MEKLIIVTSDYEIEIRVKEVKAKAEKADINPANKDPKVVEIAVPPTTQGQGSKKESVPAVAATPALPAKGSKKKSFRVGGQ